MHVTTRFLTVLLAASTLLLAACQSVAVTEPPSGPGVVQSIQETQQTSTAANAGGAIGGAVVGGLLGNQVGGGTGKTVATVVGAAAGAYGGHQAEKHYAGSKESYRITVRARDGRLLTYQQQDLNGLRVGDHVRAGPNGVFRD